MLSPFTIWNFKCCFAGLLLLTSRKSKLGGASVSFAVRAAPEFTLLRLSSLADIIQTPRLFLTDFSQSAYSYLIWMIILNTATNCCSFQLDASLLQKTSSQTFSLSWSAASQSVPVQDFDSDVIVFFEAKISTIYNLAKSFLSVLGVLVGSLNISSRVDLWNLHFLLLCWMALFECPDYTPHSSSIHFGNSVITSYIHLLLCEHQHFFFLFWAWCFNSDSSNLCWNIYTVCKLEDNFWNNFILLCLTENKEIRKRIKYPL